MMTAQGDLVWGRTPDGHRTELLLIGQRGAYVRSSGAWWKLPQVSTFMDGLAVSSATPQDIVHFDSTESAPRPVTVHLRSRTAAETPALRGKGAPVSLVRQVSTSG